MTDDLVKRLRQMQDWTFAPCREAADYIEKLGALVEQLREDNSSLIDSFDKDFLRQEARIEKLESALLDLSDGYECCPVSRSMRAIARKALEGKDD